MRWLTRLLLIGLLTLPHAAMADVLVDNVNGYTLDARGALIRFDALLVADDGKVARLLKGKDERPRAAFALNGQGRTLLPGFVDAHGRVMALGRRAMELDVSSARSLAELQAMVAAYARSHPRLTWIVGGGWDEKKLGLAGYPTAADMDAAVTERPVWLERADGHGGWANRRALAEAGIGAKTADPAAGRIERAGGGGVLLETAADLVRRAVPYNPYAAEAALAKALGLLAEAGITGVHDVGVDSATWNLYRSFGDENLLTARIYGLAAGIEEMARITPVKPTPWLYGDRLRLAAVALNIDGIAATQGAWMAPPGDKGLVRLNDTQLKNSAVRAAMNGFQVAVGANGDAAVAELAAAYDELLRTYGRDRRWRIETPAFADAAMSARFAALGVVASVRSGAAAGGERVAFGSDFPAMPLSPLAGFGQAVARGLTPAQALAGYTTGPAYAAFAEARQGSLQPGHWADFILIDRDIMEDAAGAAQARVLETWVGGKRVFQRKAGL